MIPPHVIIATLETIMLLLEFETSFGWSWNMTADCFFLWWEGWLICGHPTGLLVWRSTQSSNASYGRCSYGMGFPSSLHTWIRRCQGYRPQLYTAAPFRMNRKLYWIWVPKISGGHIPQFLVIAQVKGVASGKCRCSWWRTWRERSSYQISVPTVQWLALAPKRSTGKRPCWLSSRWIFDILRSEVLGVLVLKCPAWLLVWDRCLLPFWLVPSWDKHTVLGGDIPFVNGKPVDHSRRTSCLHSTTSWNLQQEVHPETIGFGRRIHKYRRFQTSSI